MIEIRNLEKRYGEVQALRGISTTISRGEIVGLLGPNGAGKTTTMKILVGYILPSGGSATVAGHDVVDDPIAVQRRIGYLPENAPLYPEMLVQDYLLFTADMRGLGRPLALRRIGTVADECGLEEVITRPIGTLSKGYRQRVGLAAAILHDPEILILDEPTTGLDPNQIVEVRSLIRRMGKTKTVILSTHILPEVEATCDRVVIILDGLIREDASLDSLTRSRIQIAVLRASDVSDAIDALGKLDGVGGIASSPSTDGYHRFELTLTGPADPAAAIFALAAERNWSLRELKRDDKTLEHVFRERTAVLGSGS